jgi:hypothetical protein
MWKIKFSDNPRICSEEEYQYQWDMVPQDKNIEEIRFRLLGKKYSIRDFDMCSIHRTAVHPFGSHPRFTGYKIYVIRRNIVEEISATVQPISKLNLPLGVSSKHYAIEELNRIGCRLEQFRNGTGVV